ncbi:unnamed protein product [Lactuca saligna]|uniref:Uncharacterized protein n=1 Tax=Lactuca saligna TaxID=75948 RepID=A0AA35V5T6_LACSI|nr:unnamed protein product [Lactuca saligna]
MPGRPTTNRNTDVIEKMGKHKVSKKGKPIVCSTCHMPGHNKESIVEGSMNGGAVRVQGSVNSVVGGVHGGEGGVHGSEGGGVHGVRKKKVKARGVDVAIRTRKPSERILKTKLAKAVYGKNSEGSSTTNAVDID